MWKNTILEECMKKQIHPLAIVIFVKYDKVKVLLTYRFTIFWSREILFCLY